MFIFKMTSSRCSLITQLICDDHDQYLVEKLFFESKVKTSGGSMEVKSANKNRNLGSSYERLFSD